MHWLETFMATGRSRYGVLAWALGLLWVGTWIVARRVMAWYFAVALMSILVAMVLGIGQLVWSSSLPRGESPPGPWIVTLFLLNAMFALAVVAILGAATSLLNLLIAPLRKQPTRRPEPPWPQL